MLKLYFTASTSSEPSYQDNYKKILKIINKLNCHLLSGQQIIDPKLLDKDKNLPNKRIFQREKNKIDQADLIIAEVSQPSLGVGSEIAYALTQNKPVLALLLENFQDKISPMISGNPSDNFFIEIYNFERLKYILKDFIIHIRKQKKRHGKLIVIDGGNGSGKTTQSQLLINYLKQHKIPVKLVDFPQYYSSFHGKTVAKFLRGEFGTLDQVSPYLSSLAFAVDRASIKREMDDFLAKGGYIVANRYATSSLAHQSVKFTDVKKQKEFLNWLYDLEYKVHKIPKENIVIYLYVPADFGKKLTAKKGERAYLKGQSEDIEEKDHDYRIATEKMYLQLAKQYTHWHKIDCIKENNLLPVEVIHQEIIKVLKEQKII